MPTLVPLLSQDQTIRMPEQAPEVARRQERFVVVGATRNFFKVGHTTLLSLAQTRPDMALRLGIPNIEHARLAVPGLSMEFMEWDPHRPESLVAVLEGSTHMLMVPPINRRVQVARDYINAARKAGVEYVLCLGVQQVGAPHRLSRDADQVTAMLHQSGLAFDVLNLPMFPENILYQLPSIRRDRRFTYPVSATAAFSFVTCADLGDACAQRISQPIQRTLGETHWTAIDLATCQEWAEYLSEAVGERVTFYSQNSEEFVTTLEAKGMQRPFARGVLELWEQIEAGHEPVPHTGFATFLGRRPQTLQQWTADHACCFTGSPDCAHPKPPTEHMY